MSIWLRIITTSLLVLSFVSTRAQDVVTYFNSSAKVSGDGETASMYSVRLTDDYTFVTIELIPTRNRHRMNYFTSGYTRLEFAGYTLRYKGALSSDGKSVHTCEPDDQWGWLKRANHIATPWSLKEECLTVVQRFLSSMTIDRIMVTHLEITLLRIRILSKKQV